MICRKVCELILYFGGIRDVILLCGGVASKPAGRDAGPPFEKDGKVLVVRKFEKIGDLLDGQESGTQQVLINIGFHGQGTGAFHELAVEPL